jgi:hypothetical protein
MWRDGDRQDQHRRHISAGMASFGSGGISAFDG